MTPFGETPPTISDGGTPRPHRASASSAIIRAVASDANKDPTELPPLYESIDPDALDTLFASVVNGVPRSHGEVTFSYAGYRVTLTAERDIELTPLGDDPN